MKALLLAVSLCAAIAVASKTVVDWYACTCLLATVRNDKLLETVSENRRSYSVFEYPELDQYIDRLPQVEADRMIGELLVILEDSSAASRRRATYALGRLYRTDSAHCSLVVKKISTLTNDEDYDTQYEAHRALERIAAKANEK